MVGKIALEFIVLDNRLAPLALVPEGFTNEEYRFGSALLVLGESLQNSRALLDHRVVLLAFFGRRSRCRFVGNAVETCGPHLGCLIVKALRIKHMVQIGAAGAAFKQ